MTAYSLGRGNWMRPLKGLLDILGASIALLLLAPVFVVIGIAIRRDSPGPIFFRQRRVGQYGESFVLFKFRTMVDCHNDMIHRKAIKKVWAGERISDDPKSPFKLTNDPRVTYVGRWLRRTSLDELPQLVNVLLGDMSLVGPRPMIGYELDNFKPWHYERHDIRPGITGLAQVTSRGNADLNNILELDVQYVRQLSFLTDVKLILKTIPMVIAGWGAR